VTTWVLGSLVVVIVLKTDADSSDDVRIAARLLAELNGALDRVPSNLRSTTNGPSCLRRRTLQHEERALIQVGSKDSVLRRGNEVWISFSMTRHQEDGFYSPYKFLLEGTNPVPRRQFKLKRPEGAFQNQSGLRRIEGAVSRYRSMMPGRSRASQTLASV
jgi:hypothetical protein